MLRKKPSDLFLVDFFCKVSIVGNYIFQIEYVNVECQ